MRSSLKYSGNQNPIPSRIFSRRDAGGRNTGSGSTGNRNINQKIGAIVLICCFLLSCLAPMPAQAIPAPPSDSLLTIRQGLKGGKVKLKVQGDGMHTTNVSLQLTNTTDQAIKVVIPANEVLHPNIPSVQTMLITHDIVVLINKGETAICSIKTVCASPKTIPPPPQVTEGLNFDVGDYADSAMWGQLAAVMAAGKELELVGAFGNVMFASPETIKSEIKEEVDREIKKRVDDYLMQNPSKTAKDAEDLVRNDPSLMEVIERDAGRIVNHKERRKQAEEITQLAVWRLLGLKSGKPEESVTPTSMVDDFLKQLALNAKGNSGAITSTGSTIGKDGKITPSPKLKQALDQRYTAIFDLVDLTVKRSAEPALTGIASLPKDDPCDTFCVVGERAYAQGDFTTSQELLNSAVQLAETYGEADARLSRSLNSLGLCYLNMTYFPDAQKNFDRALKLRTAVFGADSKEVGEVDNNLGVLNQIMAKYTPADQLFNSAIGIFEKTVGKTSDPVANGLNNLGKTLSLDSKPEEGIKKLQLAMALAINNSPQNVAGGKLYTPFVAEVQTNLADAYKETGNNNTASEFYRKALDIDKRTLGPDHPFLANILDGLATVTSKQGQSAEGEDFKKQADLIRERSFQSGSKDLATLPLSTGDLGRLWNYIQGKKDIQFSIATVRAAAVAPMPIDKTKMAMPIRDKWALVVGISKFKDPTISLQFAAKDATDFATYLTKEANFTPDHVRVLTNERATRAEILKEITSWLPRVASPNDLVMIFFSSHGSPSNLDLASVNFLVAYDTDKYNLAGTAIGLQDFADLVKQYVHADRIVLVMDACHSGAATGTKGFLSRYQNLDAGAVAQGTGQLVICSSTASQSSWESTRYKNGVFTHYLIEGLRNQDTKGKMKEVVKYMQKHVADEVRTDRNGAQQDPNMKTKWDGDDLMIGIKPADPHPGVADDYTPPPVASTATKSIMSGTGTKAATKTTAAGAPVHKPTTAISKQPPAKPKTTVH